MLFAKLLSAIAHVTSQLVGHWIPPCTWTPDAGAGDHFDRVLDMCKKDGFASLSEADWRDCVTIFSSVESSYATNLRAFIAKPQITIERFCEAARTHFSSVAQAGAQYVSIHDEQYPPLLREISRPPLGLTVMGNLQLLAMPAISVIGSRRTSYEALKAAVDVGVTCSRLGVPVVSGGALGCDIAVHEGVLASLIEPAGAIVVMAGGLSRLYPRSNLRTFGEILERGGAIVSERLWQQDVRPHDFPSRNRLVSGMSEVTVVMAAGARSGSLITAMEALEQGREVFVFAGAGPDARFEGSRSLLEDGGTPFFSASDLVANLGIGSSMLP